MGLVERVIGHDPRLELVDLVDPPKGNTPPPFVDAALERARQEHHGTIGRAYLETLDDLRYTDPAETVRQLGGVVHQLDPSAVPFALGVYASAHRLLGVRLDATRHALRAGLGLAFDMAQARALAGLIQRVATFEAAMGGYARAIEIGQRATLLYAQEGDLSGLGRVSTDRGVYFGNQGKLDESDKAFSVALDWLATNEHRNRFTALHGLGVNSQQRADHLGALTAFAAISPELCATVMHRGKLLWRRGVSLAALDREGFSADLDQGYGLLTRSSPVDAALCACDYVRALLMRGEYGAAIERARAVRMVTIPLQEVNRVAAVAARDLATAGMEGEQRLTLRRVSAIRKRISEAKGHASARVPL